MLVESLIYISMGGKLSTRSFMQERWVTRTLSTDRRVSRVHFDFFLQGNEELTTFRSGLSALTVASKIQHLLLYVLNNCMSR
jgi:hypothetical protein